MSDAVEYSVQHKSGANKMGIGTTAWFLSKLSELPGFKTDGKIFEADGHKFDGSYMSAEEAVVCAYCNLYAQIEARRILKEEANIYRIYMP